MLIGQSTISIVQISCSVSGKDSEKKMWGSGMERTLMFMSEYHSIDENEPIKYYGITPKESNLVQE